MENQKLTEKAQHIQACYSEIFKTDAGKIVLEDIKSIAGYGKPSFSHPYDPIQAALNDGGKMLLSKILSKIQ